VLRAYGLIFVSAVLALALAGGAIATGLALAPGDQALAASDLLTRSDLGSTWKGGAVKATRAPLSCPGYNPRSTAVTTARAAARFTATGIQIDHTVAVLAQNRMLAQFWKATYSTGFLPCLKSAFFLQMPPSTAVASAGKVAFPKLGKYTNAYRIVYETPVASGKPVIGVYDLIAIGNARTQVVLTFKAWLGTAAQVAANQKALIQAEAKIAYVAAKRAFA
jgi:hypothetical protein